MHARARPDRSDLDAGVARPPDQRGEEPDGLGGRRRARGAEPARGEDRPALPALPGAAHRGGRGGLRRPPAPHRPALRRGPRGAPLVPRPLHPRPRGRVPGHESRPVPDHPPADGGARKHLLCRGPGPVGLPLARRGHPEHPRLRDGFSRHEGHPARAELPIDQAHPRDRRGRHRPQRLAQGQGPLDRERRGGARPGLSRLGRARGGELRRPGDPLRAHVGHAVGRHRGLLPHQRPVARARGRAAPRGRAVRHRRVGQVLRAQGDQGRARVPAPRREPGRRRRLPPRDPGPGPRHRPCDARAPR